MSEPTLTADKEQDDQLQADREIRHLKNTISALREEMEGMQYEAQDNIQRAVRDANDEAAQLKATATALRDELDNLSFEKDRAVQEAVAGGRDEIQQLTNCPSSYKLEQSTA
ncbi:MAG: hypothetical protein O2817_04940 [Proteobacteria bacterium]|nr:hypothetical protein [Pseudomonadota bacterium]